jgi:hypothetical protein
MTLLVEDARYGFAPHALSMSARISRWASGRE